MFNNSGTFIISEIAQTHEGSYAIAESLVRAAAAAGVDAVKMHVFTADELAVPKYKHYQLLKQLEWPQERWRDIIAFSHELGVQFFTDVLGQQSLEVVINNGVDGIKIHGTDMRNTRLLRLFAEVDLPMMLAIGGGTMEEIDHAIDILRSRGRKSPIVLMHGIQSYPTLVEHTNLNKMRFFKDKYDLPVGYADHIDGGSKLNTALCATAVGMGASVIEKHITLSRALKMEDYESALSPDDLVEFVTRIRGLDRAMGDYSDSLNDAEQTYRKETRKQLVAAVPIERGKVIGEQDVALRRVDSNNASLDVDDVVGEAADRDYSVNDIIASEVSRKRV